MNETSHDPVSLHYMEREVEMYSLTKSEMLSLKCGDGSTALGLACALGGAFLTFLITLFTVPIQSAALWASFVACSLVCGILALYFGIESFRTRRKAEREFNSIFERDTEKNLRSMDRRLGA